MASFSRRSFLSLLPASFALSRFPVQYIYLARTQVPQYSGQPAPASTCWLDVCAPFIAEDSELGLHSEIILTSDTFVGARGYEDGKDSTEYEVLLYEADGHAIGRDGVAARVTVPAMRTTVLPVADLLGKRRSFAGGARVRLRPKGREPMHATDLFSSAFVRWSSPFSLDSVHANPDPLQWQKTAAFYYSMPYPSLRDYECSYGVFNPYDSRSAGTIAVIDHAARAVATVPFDLKPFASMVVSLNDVRMGTNGAAAFFRTAGDAKPANRKFDHDGGMVVVRNNENTRKCFGFMIIRRSGSDRFSVEHPIHQPVSVPIPTAAPFDAEGRFRARNVLFTPLIFKSKRVGGVTLDSRVHLSTGLPYEDALWFSPYTTDAKGDVAWQANADSKLAAQLLPGQYERGAIRLGSQQSCTLDFARLSLREDFSGGLGLAIAPDSNHTLMKVEVRAREWGAHAFTHFRPGVRAARAYQKPRQRGSLATDYITSGASFQRVGGRVVRDEVIAVINIDDQGVHGAPVLEVFSQGGFVGRYDLGEVPAFACRHYLLSELMREPRTIENMSFRLVDDQATLLMSVIHLDYNRRDLALDHGSDRFSTFGDFTCAQV